MLKLSGSIFKPFQKDLLSTFPGWSSSHIFEISSHIFVSSSHIFEISSHIYDGLDENKAKLSSVKLSWSLAELGNKTP